MSSCPVKMDNLGEAIELDDNIRCLHCHQLIDAATPIGSDSPAPAEGDISCCAYCGHLMGFTKDARVRELSSHERYEASLDPNVKAFLKARSMGLN